MATQTNAIQKPQTTPAPRRYPLEIFDQLQSELDRFLDGRWPARRFLDSSDFWMPRTDVYEQNGSIVVEAELPGVSKDDIKVEVQGTDLVIQGERRSEEKVEEKNFHRMERMVGSFYRRLPLPEGIQSDKIEATYSDGILHIIVPEPEPKSEATSKVPIK